MEMDLKPSKSSIGASCLMGMFVGFRRCSKSTFHRLIVFTIDDTNGQLLLKSLGVRCPLPKPYKWFFRTSLRLPKSLLLHSFQITPNNTNEYLKVYTIRIPNHYLIVDIFHRHFLLVIVGKAQELMIKLHSIQLS